MYFDLQNCCPDPHQSIKSKNNFIKFFQWVLEIYPIR